MVNDLISGPDHLLISHLEKNRLKEETFQLYPGNFFSRFFFADNRWWDLSLKAFYTHSKYIFEVPQIVVFDSQIEIDYFWEGRRIPKSNSTVSNIFECGALVVWLDFTLCTSCGIILRRRTIYLSQTAFYAWTQKLLNNTNAFEQLLRQRIFFEHRPRRPVLADVDIYLDI